MRQYSNKNKMDDVQVLVLFENKHLTILTGVSVTENPSRLFWELNVI